MTDAITAVDDPTPYSASWSSLKTPAFDSASQDYKNQMREAYLGDADLLAVNELLLIQSRSRHVSRNNPIVSAAEDKYIAKLGSVKVHMQTLEGDTHVLAQSLWDEFFSNPMADNKGDGNTMQATWNHDRFQSGEAIARMIIKKKGNANRIPLKIQNIESEYLDITYMGEMSADLPWGTTRYGITFDSYNAPIKYNFWAERHFGLNQDQRQPWIHVPVDAEDVCHIFERRRSNQWRGIPMVAPMLAEIYALTDLTDAAVAKQAASAAISWIIEQPAQSALNAPGSVRTAGNTMPQDLQRKLMFLANGGSVQYTNPGEKFQLAQSGDIGNNLIGLLKHQLQTIAAAYGIPYYMLTGDTTQLSFSAINGILLEFRNRLEYIHHFINVPDGLSKITKRFLAIAKVMYPEIGEVRIAYQFPKNYGIDLLKDYQANVLGIQSGQTTLKRQMDENHLTEEELVKDRELIRSLGFTGLLDVQGQALNATKNNSTAKEDSVSV